MVLVNFRAEKLLSFGTNTLGVYHFNKLIQTIIPPFKIHTILQSPNLYAFTKAIWGLFHESEDQPMSGPMSLQGPNKFLGHRQPCCSGALG